MNPLPATVALSLLGATRAAGAADGTPATRSASSEYVRERIAKGVTLGATRFSCKARAARLRPTLSARARASMRTPASVPDNLGK